MRRGGRTDHDVNIGKFALPIVEMDRQGVNFPDLAEDLRLPDYHRIESARHAEKMTNALRLGEAIENLVEVRRKLGMPRIQELFDRLKTFLGFRRDAVDFDPVTGRKDQALAQ